MSQLEVEGSEGVAAYLESVRMHLLDVPVEERDWLMQQARARVELALELEQPADRAALERTLARLGDPASLARQLRGEAPVRPEEQAEAGGGGRLKACRSCRREVSTEAFSCPHCGAPFPARHQWQGRGYEWKSKTRVLGVPLVHVAFGRDRNGKLRVAKGIIAIGQFGIGVITIAQFGVAAVFGIGQLMLAPLALGQFAIGLAAFGQFGLGLFYGAGQIATGILGAWGQFKLGPWK